MEIQKSETKSGKVRAEVTNGDEVVLRSVLFDSEKELETALGSVGLSLGKVKAGHPEAPEALKDALPWNERELRVFLGVDRRVNMHISRWAHDLIRRLSEGETLPELARLEDMPLNRLHDRLREEIVDLCTHYTLIQNRGLAPRAR